MAITKMMHISSGKKGGGNHLKNALDYILDKKKENKHFNSIFSYANNPDKTQGYAAAINCRLSNPLEDMRETKRSYGKEGGRQAYHFILSFKPGDTDKDTAWDIVSNFVKEYLGEKYEAVYSLHLDQEHIHGHIIFNSVSFLDGYKYRYEKGDWEKDIQPIVDRLCEERGVAKLEYHTDEYKDKDGKTKQKTFYSEHMPWNTIMRKDIDEVLTKKEVQTFDDFLDEMKEREYRFNFDRKYTRIKKEGMKTYRRLKASSIGYEYSEEMIKERLLIKQEIHRVLHPAPDSPEVLNGASYKKPYRKYKRYAQMGYYEKIQLKRTLRMKQYLGVHKKNTIQQRTDRMKFLRSQEEYLFLRQFGLQTTEDIKKKKESLERKRRECFVERKKFLAESKFRDPTLQLYQKLQALKPAEECYILWGSDTKYQAEHEAYEKLLHKLLELGVDVSSMETLSLELKREESRYKENIKELYRQIKICGRLLPEETFEKEEESLKKDPAGRKFLRLVEANRDKKKDIHQALNHITQNDYSSDQEYYMCDLYRPDCFIEIKTNREKNTNGGEYTKSDYQIYKNNTKSNQYSDDRVDGWNEASWRNLKNQMEIELGYADYKGFLMFYDKEKFLEYKAVFEEYQEQEKKKEQKERHQSLQYLQRKEQRPTL